MKPEDLVKRLQALDGLGLRSVVLYGSAAAGDHAGARSDFNVLVITDRLGLNELETLSAPASAWVKAGNPPPLLFTLEGLRRSADVFPIELMDMKECRRVLAGEDVLADVEISPDNLRLELEHELKGKLIALREQFLLTGRRPARVRALVVDSLSTFLVLMRAALRLFQPEVPARKMEALKALAAHVSFDSGVFETVQGLKEGSARVPDDEVRPLFERYLRAVIAVVDAVDVHLRGTGKGEVVS